MRERIGTKLGTGGNARWRRRKAARPQEIAAAALACFAERGFAAASLDEIAARAGVTKGTLYLYFPSKEELFKAVVREALLPRISLFADGAAAGESAARQLTRLVAAWPALVATPHLGAIPKLMIAEAGNFPELARFYVDEVIDRARRIIVGIINRGIERGEFRRVDPEAAFFSVVAPLVVAVLWQQTFAPIVARPIDIEALCRAHLAILLDGLAAERAP
ncbi:MAG TPA: TetR/AcrR family transcriptional regulator [Stellaceae bacterium]|nr:TetR/AcrR family transcriptional regulator [Stellaceae bacterium]